MERSEGRSSLFQAGHSYGNIVLNFQHAANREFGFYAHAFHKAGQTLFEQMFASNGYNDLEGCPIIFLYRHALELYLKAIVLHGEIILGINGETLLTNRVFCRGIPCTLSFLYSNEPLKLLAGLGIWILKD